MVNNVYIFSRAASCLRDKINMYESMKSHKKMLRFLYAAKSATVKVVLKSISPDLIQMLFEFFYNVLKGNVRLILSQKRQLHSNKYSL